MALFTPLHSGPSADSFGQLLREWARTDRTWLILPRDPVASDAATRVSYAQLQETATAVGRGLRAAGCRDGDRVVLAYDNGAEFCFGFFGAMLAGLVPVPFPPAYALASAEVYRERLERVHDHCSARLLLTNQSTIDLLRPSQQLVASARTLEAIVACPGTKDLPSAPQHSELAVIQYTSGTTGLPRGVELSHGNLLHNVHGILEAIGGSLPGDVACGWIPMFHDMGLIGTMLLAVYAGVPLVMLTPRDFIMRPESWLWAMSRFRAVGAAAPNFAYKLCSTRIREDKLVGLDLGAWRAALNGSESVDAATVTSFQQRFARYGFASHAMTPVYGLAEDTVACCFPAQKAEPVFDPIARVDLQVHLMARPSLEKDDAVMRHVASVGAPLLGQRVRIAAGADEEVPDRTVGDIQIGGPCVMRGYHRDAVRTAEALTGDGFLRTGDRGYIADGNLYVLGRTKDVIKRAGQLYDAMDVRAATRDVAEVKGLVASFGVVNANTGTEDLVVIAETRANDEAEKSRLRSAISHSIRQRLGAQPDIVRLVGPGMIPRTTSGKISNQEARARYLAELGQS